MDDSTSYEDHVTRIIVKKHVSTGWYFDPLIKRIMENSFIQSEWLPFFCSKVLPGLYIINLFLAHVGSMELVYLLLCGSDKINEIY